MKIYFWLFLSAVAFAQTDLCRDLEKRKDKLGNNQMPMLVRTLSSLNFGSLQSLSLKYYANSVINILAPKNEFSRTLLKTPQENYYLYCNVMILSHVPQLIDEEEREQINELFPLLIPLAESSRVLINTLYRNNPINILNDPTQNSFPQLMESTLLSPKEASTKIFLKSIRTKLLSISSKMDLSKISTFKFLLNEGLMGQEDSARTTSFFNNLVKNYFSHKNFNKTGFFFVQAQKLITLDFINKGEITSLSEEQKMKMGQAELYSLVMNSGPFIQKFFQFIINGIKDPKIKDTLSFVKSGFHPVTPGEALKIIQESYGEEKTNFSKLEPLGTATVGSVYKGIYPDGKTVVFKIRKPGIETEMHKEKAILMEIAADDPWGRDMIEKIEINLNEEMDFRIELKSLLDGIFAYHKKIRGIEVIAPVEEFSPKDNIIAITLAPGSPLGKTIEKIFSSYDKEKEEILNDARGFKMVSRLKALKKRTAEYVKQLNKKMGQFFGLWFTNALFKQGMFHADLHEGNFFIEFKPLAKNPKDWFKITLIDFGNSGRFSKDFQKKFREFMWLFNKRKVEKMTEKLATLGVDWKKFITDKNKFYQITKEIISKKDQTNMQRMESFFLYLVNLGVNFPPEILAFSRGQRFLEQHIVGLNKVLLSLSEEGFPIKNSDLINIERIGMWEAIKNLNPLEYLLL